jgi:hypothetical protein
MCRCSVFVIVCQRKPDEWVEGKEPGSVAERNYRVADRLNGTSAWIV